MIDDFRFRVVRGKSSNVGKGTFEVANLRQFDNNNIKQQVLFLFSMNISKAKWNKHAELFRIRINSLFFQRNS